MGESRFDDGFEAALASYDVVAISGDGQFALGRLAALELLSYVGMREARRALSRERQTLLRNGLEGVFPMPIDTPDHNREC